MRAHEFLTENREQILAQRGIKLGSLVDLTKQFPTYTSLIGQVKEIAPNGKLKIEVVHTETTNKKPQYFVGDYISMAPNYINRNSVITK